MRDSKTIVAARGGSSASGGSLAPVLQKNVLWRKQSRRSNPRGGTGLLLLILASAPTVLAAQQAATGDGVAPHQHCAEDGKGAYVAGMGLVDEERLQAHIDEMEAELESAAASLPRSRQQRKSMERHLAKMQQAMREMQGASIDEKCRAAAMAAPVDQRIQVLERRLDATQKLLEQVMARQKEMERE